MAIFHFAWDLEFFGYVDPGMTRQLGWKLFARAIASSFLVLVGVSLFLAHARAIRWPSFGKRLVQIAAGAGLITAATLVATPESFIFFGILHHIALASLAGLAFLHVPAGLLLLLAGLCLAAPLYLRSEWFDHPLLWWVGLSSQHPVANDYVPLLPWFAAVLTGIAIARIASRTGLLLRLQPIRAPRPTAPLVFFGRHGLAFYLIHQPVLIGALWLFAQFGPSMPAAGSMVDACLASCSQVRGQEFCVQYCGCVRDGLEVAGILDGMTASGSDDEAMLRASEPIAAACLAAVESAQGEQP